MPTKFAKKEEQALREDLSAVMSKHWIRTWHEDRQVNPGVPDLSYVMRGGGFETGWLELKAEVPADVIQFDLQPAQHDWITRHERYIPVHFLCAIGAKWFLIDGSRHQDLARRTTLNELKAISIAFFDKIDAERYLPAMLRDLTKRIRNAS